MLAGAIPRYVPVQAQAALFIMQLAVLYTSLKIVFLLAPLLFVNFKFYFQ